MVSGYDNREYYIAVFQSKNHAVRLYYTLEKRGYKFFKLISAPCQLKAGCNYSIKFLKLQHLAYLKKEAEGLGMEVDEIYLAKKVDGKKFYRKQSHLT